ncbi:Fe3+ hydroxamate ABC transporter substrate-binding protein [Planococcus glaciei]|uniref:Fe3+ hydroxamate ABC transporter substrate-binding protein n=1 Tax=Planococcus glaciei TaxID=459472 RepID=UPI000942D612|nr:Fe3+ hydroxamate ABC transporter substrate-binding protein [Planococcus glaciei]
MTLFNEKPKCASCDKEIEGDEVVFIKMRFPKRKGFTEVKAYLKNEGEFICEACISDVSGGEGR